MNYAGKFDAAISLDGQGSRSPAYVHVDSFTAKAHGHVPEGAFVVPDPNLIFNGEFKRAGLDLVLSHEGHEFVVHDYFRGDKRAAIASPDGAHLTGDVVNALTGHVQYAQAAPGAAAAQVIGHVTKLTGSATAIRNGVSVILNNGDNVEKGDVVATGADSTLGITFIDGTVFGLSSNARMVLNEMVYDPNGSNNSSLLSLVAGTITFVAGETAKHGDMKVDTPVATMGIRGTAVLTQIDFVVPSGGGDPQPQASFQVLVEPNGATGSYILFDKVTLLPIATVNQAGQMIQISGGNVSVTNGLLSPDVQKLITDVFTLKFTDNNTNTKLATNFTDTITQTSAGIVFKTPAGYIATAVFTNLNPQDPHGPSISTSIVGRFPGKPLVQSLDLNGNVKSVFSLTERANTTGDTKDSDTVSGRITFLDQNLGDRPTVSVNLADAPNYVYKNAGQQDVTGSLTALQKQDIAATQIKIDVVADAGNNNHGSAVWTYTIPDHVFDFLAAGETLTLTYMVRVDNNFSILPETSFIPITITITGTNDKPVITTSVPAITFAGGTSVPGGPLTSHVPTSGTLTFKDVDLTDTHTVGVSHFSAVLPGGTVPKSISDLLSNALSVSIAAGNDSTGTGTGTINWSLADIPVYLADFIPKGEVLTLTYTVTVTDSQGATSDQTITVTITGTDTPAVVWIATSKPDVPPGGFWKDGANWETGTVPTINDDVIVITDQLHGLTPSYPVTIDAAAYAKSLTMDDYDTTVHHTAPEVINHSTLTIAGTLTLNADAKFTNSADGHVFVGGAIDVETITRKSGLVVTNTSTITNAGTLTLAAGGTIDTLTTIANSGTIDLSGGTLALKSSIANSGNVTVGAGGKLTVNGATIDGGAGDRGPVLNGGTSDTPGGTHVATTGWPDIGTVTNNGELDLTGNAVLSNGLLNNNAVLKVSGIGNALDYETVTNAGNIEVLAGGALAIDQGSTVDNSSGNVIVDGNAVLTLHEATISGGSINNYSGVLGGKIDVTGNSTLDGNVTLNKGSVTVESGVTLTLDDATVAGAAITNRGIVKVDASQKLALNGATMTGGTLTVSGTLESTGTTTITDTNISNSYLIEAIGGVLALMATPSATAITNGGIIRANGGELDVNGEAVTNTGTLAAINDGTLKLAAMTVNNTGGTVSIESGSTLDLAGAIIDGGTVTLSGTLESTGTSAIDCADITNFGTISVTSGTLTIDSGVLHAITNHSLIEAANGGTLKLMRATITNTGGTITVDGASKLYLTDVSINGGSLSNAGNLYSVCGLNTITGSVTNTGTIEVQSGTLNLSGGLTGAGTLIIDDKATLELGGSVSGAVGLNVVAHGDVTITNDGHVTGTTSFGININHDDAGGIGRDHITNTGSVAGADGFAAISIQENGTGKALIDNSGIIGAGSVTATTYAIVETGGGITINNTGHINGNISVASATFHNEATGIWTVAGTSVFGNASSIVNAGEIDLLNGASISVKGLGITNFNEIDSWGTTSITGAIANNHLIEVHTGALTLFGSLSGSGSVTVDAGARLDVKDAVSQTITLAGDGAHLQIDTSTFGGSIAALSATDTIDLSTIKYGIGTSAVYVANADPSTGGVLTVTDADGNHICLNLTGADYRNAHFAGSDDGSGHTLITLNADDDAPSFTAAEASPHVSVTERDNTTGSGASDPAPAATGTIHFTDVDLTDRPTATITSQSVTWLNADHTTQLTLTPDETAALEQALTLQQAGKNNGTVTWSYSVADSALDFLGRGQTATVDSTITLDDLQGQKDTAEVTVTITGANDAPTLASVTIGPLVDTAVTDSFSNLTGKLIGTDADSGETATLTYAVLDAHNQATSMVTGHYGALTVNSNGTYSYVPDAAAINALPAGSYSDTFKVQTTDVHGASGTATLTVDVTGANDAPVFNVDHVSVTQTSDERVIVHGLSVTDADAAANETFTIAATTHDSGSHVSPSSAAGSLAYINSKLQTVTYREGNGEPSTDKVTLTVTDGHGATDTINLIFNLAENANDHVSPAGTSGKDVFFGTSYQDQFVFAANSNHDTIVNFTPHQDHIDLSAVVTTSSISDWMSHHVAASPTNSADTLITIDPADTILLKGVSTSALHASDFIVHS